MAETTTPSPEQQALRRRARRRLVGAIALALLAVVVLPMVFDPEPKPMANNVDIRIPDQNAPLAPIAKTSAPPEPEPAPVPAPAVDESVSAPAMAVPEATPSVAPSAAPKVIPAPVPKAEKPPVTVEPTKSRPKPPAENKANTVAKPAQPVSQKASAASAAQVNKPYYLQLGVFSSEENAKRLSAQALSVGFKSSVQTSAGQFKVWVGPVADRAKAQDYQAKLKSKGLASVLVEP